ncbi:MAG: XdhC family protein [Calditrichaeota bacterium]|nr:XdhC family protein [Calditrichota bacterium]
MKDFQEILSTSQEWIRQKRKAVMVTVVRVAGSTYRRPGARMLIDASGEMVGTVSGGCLEADIAEHAKKVIEQQQPVVLKYDTMTDDGGVWGLGSGCNGIVEVLLEPLTNLVHKEDYFAFFQSIQAGYQPGYFVTVIAAHGEPAYPVGCHLAIHPDGSALGEITRPDLLAFVKLNLEFPEGKTYRHLEYATENERYELLVEQIVPPPELVIFGAGQDAEPVVELAAFLGWRVVVVDHRPLFAQPDRFPAATQVFLEDYGAFLTNRPIQPENLVIIMTHHFLHDLTILKHLCQHPPAYIGVLGPRRRTQQLLDQLKQEGEWNEQFPDRLFSPVGLDIGSESPEEIALSIISEIQAVRARRNGGFLKSRKGPIHL